MFFRALFLPSFVNFFLSLLIELGLIPMFWTMGGPVPLLGVYKGS